MVWRPLEASEKKVARCWVVKVSRVGPKLKKVLDFFVDPVDGWVRCVVAIALSGVEGQTVVHSYSF